MSEVRQRVIAEPADIRNARPYLPVGEAAGDLAVTVNATDFVGGVLMLGATEVLPRPMELALVPCGPGVYRKVGQP